MVDWKEKKIDQPDNCQTFFDYYHWNKVMGRPRLTRPECWGQVSMLSQKQRHVSLPSACWSSGSFVRSARFALSLVFRWQMKDVDNAEFLRPLNLSRWIKRVLVDFQAEIWNNTGSKFWGGEKGERGNLFAHICQITKDKLDTPGSPGAKCEIL